MKHKTTIIISIIFFIGLIFLVANYIYRNKETKNWDNTITVAPITDKEMAIKLVQDYIYRNNIEVINIKKPSKVIEDEGYWFIDFEIKQEPVPLLPFRRFVVEKSTGRVHEIPRM